jgi:hypothetical protein
LKLGVHYCSLENKHTGQVYQQNNGMSLPRRMYVSPRDYFIKTARVFGEDVSLVRQALDRAGYHDYVINDQYNNLEFHVNQIGRLKKLEVEIGISTSVIEARGSDFVFRELKVDVVTPQTFRLSKDI